VKMKVNPKTANEVLHISAEALTKLLYHNDEVTHAARAGRSVPPLEDTEDLKGARSILSSLKHSSGKTFGTNEERTEMRRRVFAYYHTFGRPHLMITVSPRDDNSFWIAVHSKFDASTPEAVAKSYEDLNDKGMPFPQQMTSDVLPSKIR